MATDVNLLAALLTHLTLPPRLPPGKDIDDSILAPALTDLALHGLTNLKKLAGEEFSFKYDVICASLKASRSLQTAEGFNKSTLLHQFGVLQNETSDAFLLLHVPAQNAGLLLWKSAEQVICNLFTSLLISIKANSEIVLCLRPSKLRQQRNMSSPHNVY